MRWQQGCLIVLFLTFRFLGAAHLDAIPADSYEARQWLQCGFIDSLTFEQLAELYNQPLSIPMIGPEGVGALVTRFGRSTGPLPSSFASYQPWTPRQQARFWKDFPFLLDFAPLLCFDAQPSAFKANLDLASSFAPDGRLDGAQRMGFATQAHSLLRGTISSELSPDSIRITKLFLQLTLPRRISLQLGNFSAAGSSSLLWGHFLPANALAYDPGPLLDYCAHRSGFRGAQCQLLGNENCIASFLLHVRPLEQGMRGQIRLAAPCGLHVQFAAAAQRVGDGRQWDTLWGGEVSVSYEKHPFFASVETAANDHHPGALPVVLVVKHTGSKNAAIVLRYVSVPSCFYAPLGFWSARINGLLDIDSCAVDKCLYQLEGVYSLAQAVVLRTHVDYLVASTQAALYETWGIAITGKDQTLLMSSSVVLYQHQANERALPQRFSARWSWQVSPACGTLLGFSATRAQRQPSLRTELGALWDVSQTIHCSPRLTIRYRAPAQPQAWVGGELKMTFFERTWGVTRVSWPLQANPKDEGSIDVSMRFAL